MSTILPPPSRTWIHNFFDWNPIIRAIELLPKTSRFANNLPNEMAHDKYILPYINAVDDILISHTIGGKKLHAVLQELDDALNEIAENINVGSTPITPEDARDQAATIVEDFLNANRDDLNALGRELGPISDEMLLEHKLAEFNEEQKFGDYPIPTAQAITKATAIIEEYERKSGKTFSDKQERAEIVANGSPRMFYLEARQAKALLDDVNIIQYFISSITDPDFITNYKTGINQAIGTDDRVSIKQSIKKGFTRLTAEARDAELRSDPGNREQSQALIWQATKGSLETINRKRISLRNGYVNPHERILPVVKPAQKDNTEAYIMDIEGMDPSDASQAGRLLGLLKELYEYGKEHEAIEAIDRLNKKSGRAKKHELLDALAADIDKPPSIIDGSGQHYKHFVRTVKEAASVPHSPDRFAQRHIFKMWQELSYWFHHARKFPSPGKVLSTPGRIFFKDKPMVYVGKHLQAHFTGAKSVETIKNKDDVDVYKINYLAEKPEGTKGFGTAKHYGKEIAKVPVRFTWNVVRTPFIPGIKATKFLFTSDLEIMKFVRSLTVGVAAFGLGLTAAEEITEEFTGHDIHIAGVDLDLGSRMFAGTLQMVDGGLKPLKWNVAAVEKLAGLKGYEGITIKQENALSWLPFTDGFNVNVEDWKVNSVVSTNWNLREINHSWVISDRFEDDTTERTLDDFMGDGAQNAETRPKKADTSLSDFIEASGDTEERSRPVQKEQPSQPTPTLDGFMGADNGGNATINTPQPERSLEDFMGTSPSADRTLDDFMGASTGEDITPQISPTISQDIEERMQQLKDVGFPGVDETSLSVSFGDSNEHRATVVVDMDLSRAHLDQLQTIIDEAEDKNLIKQYMSDGVLDEDEVETLIPGGLQ